MNVNHKFPNALALYELTPIKLDFGYVIQQENCHFSGQRTFNAVILNFLKRQSMSLFRSSEK